MRSVYFILMAAVLNFVVIGCGQNEPTAWELLAQDPNTDRNALYDRNAKVCGASTSDARPGCTYHYDGQKLRISDDPKRDFGNWTQIIQIEHGIDCWWDGGFGWNETYICKDYTYTRTFDKSPSGIIYDSTGRATNARSSGKTNGFVASHKNANKLVKQTAERYHAVYGMSKESAARIAGQVLTVRANKGILEESDALARSLAMAFPKTLTAEEAQAAITAARENKDFSPAKTLLDKVSRADLANMTPEQRQMFLSQELGLGF